MQTVLARPAHPLPPENLRIVLSAPAPRSVTLLFVPKVTCALRLYVPAFKNTTCPLGQDAIALLICAADAPGLSVAQTVVRTGIPPATPARVQSVVRLELITCACAWVTEIASVPRKKVAHDRICIIGIHQQQQVT